MGLGLASGRYKGAREGLNKKSKGTYECFDLGGNRTHDLRISSTVTLPILGAIPTEVKKFFLYLVWFPDSLY